MGNISTRVDDATKAEAERIADEIGITLSTAVNVFLKRFIADNGFPFDVVSHKKVSKQPVVNVKMLDTSIKKAISDPNNIGSSQQFTYLDPNTNEPITILKKDV